MLKKFLLTSMLFVMSIQNFAFSTPFKEEERGFFDFFSPKKEEPSTPKLYHLVIIGCARSGMSYTKKLFSKLDLPKTENTPQLNTFIAWTMGDDMPGTHPKQTVLCSEYANVFHQVRDPLKTISSLYTNFSNLNRHIWPFVRTRIPEILDEDDLLTTSAKYYYYWNKKCEERAHYRFKIEEIEKTNSEFEKRAGIHLEETVLEKLPKTVGHHFEIEHTFTWKELEEKLPKELVKNLKAQAKTYGYPTK